ncbi:polysaccharide deacetylase family protein [Bacillus spongiae]|uniref:Polysaccharide deacetylase family protein n=1 Tax=Bacillus spongiae TaxID=2683610 RepID=A0ABU8H9M5_9BACI
MRSMILISALFLLTACTSNEPLKEESQGSENKMGEEQKEKTVIENKEEETREKEQIEEFEENEVVAEPQYKLNPNTWSIEPIAEANESIVLLTIDDAPDKHSIEMAQTLKDLQAPAIFFVNGHFLDTPEEQEVLKEIHKMGFPIGNHTYSHSNLSDLNEEKQREEILSLNDIIEEITGERPKFFRAPFGVNTDFSKAVVAEENMVLMNWTYGYDWEAEYQNKESITDIMVNTPLLSNGANLLMHDRSWTNDALADIVKGLREKDYEIIDPYLIESSQTAPF